MYRKCTNSNPIMKYNNAKEIEESVRFYIPVDKVFVNP